jgi:hypothetical protein
VDVLIKERFGVDVKNKQLKMIFYACIGMDLVAVAVIIVLVNVIAGLVAAAVLLAGEYVLYRVLFRSNNATGEMQENEASAETIETKQRQASEMIDGWEAVNNAIKESGLPAEATILKAWELGINVNGKNPAMQFQLEVRPADRPSFQAQATCVVAEASLANFQPGNVIQIKYDPEDLTRVAVVHS